ncbi:MAG: TIR domain-containing protein [Anaerolineae bacterium]
MKRVFISYSRRQKTFADRLARDLSDAGLDVWIDFRQIEGGERWRDEIYKGLEKSEGVVFCLSPDAIKSEWCRREVATARSQSKPVYPVVVVEALELLDDYEETAWMAEIQYIPFEERYEQGINELITALSGKRDPYDDIDPAKIPNPFKGLEAFQQTDAHIFFGREDLVQKLLEHLSDDMQSKSARFLAVVGASGSGKSSLVRAGLIPALRSGKLPGSDKFPIAIVTPGASPLESLTMRLMPLLPSSATMDEVYDLLNRNPQSLHLLVEKILENTQDATHMVLVVDQFEEIFTRASEADRERFINLLHTASTIDNGHTLTVMTMRADFFGSLSKYPVLAELFERENMVIATEMTAANLRRSIEGPAQAVGLVYDPGLVDRILDDVRQQPGSLPLLQYALKELYLNREGRRLTIKAYEEIGGVQRALAQHAEDIYGSLNAAQQDIMRRVLLRLIEVSDTGEATRRKIARTELTFRGISDEAVQEVVDLLTAADSRLLIASREIPKVEQGEEEQPVTWLEVSHEALIRQWERFKSWVAADVEELRYSAEILKAARDWERANRDSAYLLTGTRLTHAESFLENADINALQREFVQASIEERKRQQSAQFEQQQRELELQKRDAQRLRLFVIALGIFSIIAIGLLGLVGLSLNEAQRQRDEAERQSAQAGSLALAANALRVSQDNENDLGLALAITANLIANPPPVEAQRALAELAYLPGTRHLLTGHLGPVTGLSINGDGTLALSGSDDHTLILWDVATGTMLRQFGTAVATTTTLSSTLASADSLQPAGVGHANRITGVAISPDGTHGLSAGADSVIIYWDLTTGEEVWRINNLNSPVRSIAFNPDGQSAAFGNAQGNVSLRSMYNGSVQRTLSGGAGTVLSLAYSADGTQLLCGTLRNAMILWDVASGTEIHRFEGHTSSVNSVALSHDGQYALSGSNDSSIILWNLNTAAIIERLTDEVQEQINSVAFDPTTSRILSADKNGVVAVWTLDGTPIHYLYAHEGAINAVAYTSDDRAISAGTDGTLRVLDTEGDETIREDHVHSEPVNAIAVSPDGTMILTGSDDSAVALVDIATGAVIRTLSGHSDKVNAAAFSPDGTLAASASRDDTVIIWDVATGTAILTFTGHTDEVNSVAFSPNGQQIASGDTTGTLLLWDVATGQIIFTLSSPDNDNIGHEDTVYDVAFSPDGTQLLSADGEGAIILWDLAAGTELRRFGMGVNDERHDDRINSIAISPDGQYALSGSDDRTMILWNMATGASIRRFLEQGNRVKSVAFSPDGQIAASGAFDGTLRLWDVATGTEIRRYGGGISSPRINSVAFSPDGHSVVSGDNNGSVTQWRVFTVAQELVDWTERNRFVPVLTQDQCDLFRIQADCPAPTVSG